ncbi:hypothetical protein M0R72_08870 [Candidatus Pacearchaeota archaeon]|nr:hypothetical protein [Candidatus Pacearchaeota archaeon]
MAVSEDRFMVTTYRGLAVRELTEADVDKPFQRHHTAFLGWGLVSKSDVGKVLLVEDGHIARMESAEQRDARRENPARYRINWMGNRWL